MRYIITFETSEELTTTDCDDILEFITQYGNEVDINEIEEQTEEEENE